MLESLVRRYSRLGLWLCPLTVQGGLTYGALELVDSYPGMGPLNGLYSAFSQTDEDLIFLTATDLGDERLALHLAGEINDMTRVS